MGIEHVDVLVVGAGISGIGAGYHLQVRCPGRSYAILEARDDLGGTWDLFRYPGIRSDSDMYTLGYSFQPWTGVKAIADGDSILNYLRETSGKYGIDRKIRLGHRVQRAEWSSERACWTVTVQQTTVVSQMTCNFLFMCSGYYNYSHGYTPSFDNLDRFRGQIVHPQQWSEKVDYAGKRVVVIGSGATAVTLVPELAERATHVTMLQRSPTYMAAMPDEDAIAGWLRRHLSTKVAYFITRWKNILFGLFFFKLCRRNPQRAKTMLLRNVREALGPDYDVARHFTPSYNPWEQRLCLVRNGDLFRAIRSGQADVITDQIETFTADGIVLQSGATLPADLVVTATGLDLKLLSGIDVVVDGQRKDLTKSFTYKGLMLSDIPNLAFSLGYSNASWTLKSDLTGRYVCRLLNYMDRHSYRQCCARQRDPALGSEPIIDFSSGYVRRALDRLPRQGSRWPWRLAQNYVIDLVRLGHGAVDDGVMEFSSGKSGHQNDHHAHGDQVPDEHMPDGEPAG